MTGFGRRHGCTGRLNVSHLSNKDHIGIFAKRRTHSGREIGHIGVELSLMNEAAYISVNVLHRVFDRDNVALAIEIDLVNQRGQGRRLTASGRSCHDDQSIAEVGKISETGRQVPVGKRPEFVSYAPNRDRHLSTLLIQIDSKSGFPQGVREIERSDFFVNSLLSLVDNRERHIRNSGSPLTAQRLEGSVDSNIRGTPLGEVQVRSVEIDDTLEELIESVDSVGRLG